MKSIPDEEKGSRQLLTLTKSGHRFLTENRIAGKDQALYFGFAKPREAHHDADLYRLYQKAADKIERGGGRNLWVVLDYELKKRVYHELAKLGPDRASAESKRTVAERHGLQVVRGKIPLPDVRIEYDTPPRESEPVWTSNLPRAITADGISRKKSAQDFPSMAMPATCRISGAFWINGS